ncbi:hypothetical protein HYU09_02245 [Candidatus Woesearchaeota archaeon]|nr:hypothetical protein [Candidatus Woesearchaeota archaeon]
MNPAVLDPNAAIIPLKDRSLLESRVLSNDGLTDEEAAAFVKMFNETWPFASTDEEGLRGRISDGLTIGSFIDGKPANLLQTRSLNVAAAILEAGYENYRARAEAVCRYIIEHKIAGGCYDGLIRIRDERDPRAMVLVDLTTAKEFEGRGIAGAVISYVKALYLNRHGLHLLPTHNGIGYILTFSPMPKDYSPDDNYMGGAVGLHKSQGAFDTKVRMNGARVGHTMPDVVFACYAAQGFETAEPKHTILRKVTKVLQP